jgi:hypothetical protein
MALDTRDKNKVFKQCIHEMRKTQGINESFFKEKREEILSLVEYTAMNWHQPNQYRERTYEILEFIANLYQIEVRDPLEQKHQVEREHILSNLLNLRADLDCEFLDLLKVQSSETTVEWGGAGVIISADRLRKSGEGVLVIYTQNSTTISWLICRLRDICAPLINFQNKYWFYGEIAQSIQAFIAEQGDSKDFLKDLMLYVVDRVIALLDLPMHGFLNEFLSKELGELEEVGQSA